MRMRRLVPFVAVGVALLAGPAAHAAVIGLLSESATGSVEWQFVPGTTGEQTYHGSSLSGFSLGHTEQQAGLGVDVQSRLEVSSLNPGAWSISAVFNRVGPNQPSKSLFGWATAGMQWIFEAVGDNIALNWLSSGSAGVGLVTLYDMTGTPVQLTAGPGGVTLLNQHIYSLNVSLVAGGGSDGHMADISTRFISNVPFTTLPEPVSVVLLVVGVIAIWTRRR